MGNNRGCYGRVVTRYFKINFSYSATELDYYKDMGSTLARRFCCSIVAGAIFSLFAVLFPIAIHAQSDTHAADINSDGVVNGLDYVLLFENFRISPIGELRADINGDGIVNGLDYVILFENFGRTRPASSPTFSEVQEWVIAYKAAHPGRAGDITDMTPGEIAADLDAQRLASICGANQRPVIPMLSWEYGGNDHAWINSQASALVYCVYIPVSTSTDYWGYNAAQDRVTADVYVLFPDQNPCKNSVGKDQVIACLGDPTNSEILVDTASLHDGVHASGLPTLQNASTELNLIMTNGSKVFLLLNI